MIDHSTFKRDRAAYLRDRLKYHVTGAIERGEAQAIVAMDDPNHPDLVAARAFLNGINKITKGKRS